MLPDDASLWTDLALFDDKYGDNAGAKVAISNAQKYGLIYPQIYNYIMNNRSFSMTEYGYIIKI
jgi:Flp pilus assembly protein TadD